ncbi:purine-cytosine permease family protein [Pararhodobacter aggregans]|uniref:Cytosine permease n=1 Tax=Pararhodobacter aggregans TaxID=404875 RepID=A0A2T7UT49_9RHOB|nr:cytosine permease [Pararhodobacter aggregans]PTX03468.1 cytosine permease [Pararhodobacter aggregans]PVE47758.1 cytosine permease [Pararhodobacter aggregans]
MTARDNSKALDELEGQVDDVLGSEYEHEPVPLQARHSTFSVSTVWIGFPMILTSAMTGSLMVAGMGFEKALWAMVIGNAMMFAYVGALGVLGTRTGMNFALLATLVFGRKGYVIASGLLSTLLLGWFAVQTGITGNLIHTAYGVSYLLMTIVAGVIYLGITFVGIRGLHWIGLISVPLFVVLGTWVAYDSASQVGWSAVYSYAGANPELSMAFGIGLTMVIALFIDAGTVTADFNRWAKDTKGSLIATFSAFPFANLYGMLVGGIMTAALALPDPQPFGSDNMFGYLVNLNLPWLSVIAFAFVLCNLGSVCAHCLYNSAVGWSRIAKSRMRVMAVILAVFGIAIAATNVWAMFVPWLSLLGILVPPIGAIMIVDLYFTRTPRVADYAWRGKSFAAWIIGSLAAFLVEGMFPGLSTAVSAFVIGALAYWALTGEERRANAELRYRAS